MIDPEGYRLNVGIVIANADNKLLWGKRAAKSSGWQFPQGGISEGEQTIDAMYRELKEELGLAASDVELISESKQWLSYDLPEQFRRYHSKPLCVGQKQRWFLLRLISPESSIKFDQCRRPEFVSYKWIDYWYAADHVIDFKMSVYRDMLTEFESVLFTD